MWLFGSRDLMLSAADNKRQTERIETILARLRSIMYDCRLVRALSFF